MNEFLFSRVNLVHLLVLLELPNLRKYFSFDLLVSFSSILSAILFEEQQYSLLLSIKQV